MAVSSRATSSGSNTRMSVRRGRASSAAAKPAPPAATAASTHAGRLTRGRYRAAAPEASPRAAGNPTTGIGAQPGGLPNGELGVCGCPQPLWFADNGGVLLDEVAGTSAAVANSSARLAKVERLA